MIRAVVFDLGKVLIHFDTDRFAAPILAQTGKTPQELADYFLHSPEVLEFSIGKSSPREFYARSKQALGLTSSYEEFAVAWSDVFTPIPESMAVARELKGKLPRVILSNTNALHIEHILRKFPEYHDFDGHVFSQEVGLVKPDAAIYEWTLRRYGFKADETVFFDDLPANIAGAKAVGMRAIQFHNATQMRQELIALGVNL